MMSVAKSTNCTEVIVCGRHAQEAIPAFHLVIALLPPVWIVQGLFSAHADTVVVSCLMVGVGSDRLGRPEWPTYSVLKRTC